MTGLTNQEVREALVAYGADQLPERVISQIQIYLEVFEMWSRRVNLTTVRRPAEVVRRHFGEGFALAKVIPSTVDLLDLGSGAGFPGIPIALASPEITVTLAEVQAKKAAFLGEVIARMDLPASIWSRRAEDLLKGERRFGVVALRAVDNMRSALQTGMRLLRPGGRLVFFVGPQQEVELPSADWAEVNRVDLPGCSGGAVLARLE